MIVLIFKKERLDRNVKLNFTDLLNLDKKNREIIQKKEKLDGKRKLYQKKDKTQFEKSKKISLEIEF